MENSIFVNSCSFVNNSGKEADSMIKMQLLQCYSESKSGRNRITFHNCRFVNNTFTGSVINVGSDKNKLSFELKS